MKTAKISRPKRKFPSLKEVLIRLAWLSIVTLSVVYSAYRSSRELPSWGSDVEKWTYVYINFGSFVAGLIAAIIIFWRKSKDWLAVTVSLMLITWTSTSDGFEFWLDTGIGGSGTEVNWFLSYFLSLPYTVLLSVLLLCVLLTFPDGKWTPGWTRWFFILSVVGTLLLPVYMCGMLTLGTMIELTDPLQHFFLDLLPEYFRLGVLLLGALAQIYRLFTTNDPFQRQQLKWIAVSLVGMTVFYILYYLASLWTAWTTDSPQMLTLFLLTLFFTYGFIVTFAISLLRYRIWDIDLVINKTLVYSALTTILGSLGLAGAVLFDFYAKEFLNSNSPVLAVLVILPLIALFSPLRDALQQFVDTRFKPEEIDFSNTIVEFTPEAQLMLSSSDILKILARQVREQLNVSEVEIFLKHENGDLFLSEPLPAEGALPSMALREKERLLLEKGEVVVPPDTSNYSLYLPLTLKRASRPEFLGAMALGKRENGLGYSSAMLRSLKQFGVEAGKVLYVAKLRESTGRNIMERLASIERGLASLRTSTT